MTSPPCPCPTWCQGRQEDHDAGFHRSPHEYIPIAGPDSQAAAYAAQVKDGRTWVSVHASPVLVDLDEPDEARELAGLIELLATATRRQHRDLAAQIRRAADIADTA